MQALYQRRTTPDRFVSPELARRLTELTRETGRQIGLLIDRLGVVDRVIVGDAHRLFIPDLGRSRAGSGRFRGLRLVHTHLRGEGLSRDDLTDLALLRLDTVVVVQTGPGGLPGEVEYAALVPPGTRGGEEGTRVERVRTVHEWDTDFTAFIQELEVQFGEAVKARDVSGREGAVLVSVTTRDPKGARRSLAELCRLAETAGLFVADQVLQVRKAVDGRTLVGEGKLRDLVTRCMHLGADVLIFDQELSPSQLRNIATETDLKVLDRTQLILDIFSQRATTKEGKLQVELAQLRYRKPRLNLMPTAMSRLTGGIGGRGPGETKLEINRRRSDERETRVERQLEDIARERTMRRDRRKRVGLPLVAIVGYTNAGKSTLLNRMTNSAVDAEDKLFATLDPTSRRLRFPEMREIILTDTVGFIRNLPKDLVHAFRSTLDEVLEADLLLHVVNIGEEDVGEQKAAVDKVLGELGAGDTPTLLVLNQIDRVEDAIVQDRVAEWGGLPVSAQTGAGLDALLDQIERRLFRERAAQAWEATSADRDPPHSLTDRDDDAHLP